MKVGTDGVLLGAWANVENTAQILDIGTGTGLIALMLAQRKQNAIIDALEIEENAYQQACENVVQSKWNNRISIFHTSLQEFESSKKYDLIVSNPPFFSQSLKNRDNAKTAARHNDSLSPLELAQHSKRLLTPNGRIAVIYPMNEAQLFLKIAQKMGLYPRRITQVIPAISKQSKRTLVEIQQMPCDTIETELCIEKEQRHTYTDEYIDLTKDFYLHL